MTAAYCPTRCCTWPSLLSSLTFFNVDGFSVFSLSLFAHTFTLLMHRKACHSRRRIDLTPAPNFERRSNYRTPCLHPISRLQSPSSCAPPLQSYGPQQSSQLRSIYICPALLSVDASDVIVKWKCSCNYECSKSGEEGERGVRGGERCE